MLQPKKMKFRKTFKGRIKGEILGHDPLAQDRLMMEAQTSGVRPAREERGNR